MTTAELPSWLKPGAQFQMGGRRYTFRFVDEDMVVYRRWRRRSADFSYEAMKLHVFIAMINHGVAREVL